MTTTTTTTNLGNILECTMGELQIRVLKVFFAKASSTQNVTDRVWLTIETEDSIVANEHGESFEHALTKAIASVRYTRNNIAWRYAATDARDAANAPADARVDATLARLRGEVQ